MDYIIVGGGVYGCGVAWELARRGAEVLLLEANEIASGASGGLGKRGVRANGRDLRELPLMARAYERWPELHDEIGGPTGYERTGHLLLLERDIDLISAPAFAWMQEEQGIPTQMVSASELRELEPYVGEQVLGAIHCPKDGVADHTQTTRSFAEAARRHGAEIREQTMVTAVEMENDRATAVLTADGDRFVIGKALILLSNSSVAQLLQAHVKLRLPIWPMLPQVMLTEVVDPMPLRHLIGHAHRTLAMKPQRGATGQQVMISGGWRGKWNAESGKGDVQPDQVAGNLAEAVVVYPSLAGVNVSQSDAGRLETVSADGVPIIDTVSDITNLFYATGWCGHGWAIAPAVTRLLADWVIESEQPELLNPFGYGRFLK